MERRSSSCIIKELQIKIMMRYYYTLISVTKIQNTDTAKCWKGCKAAGTLIHCC